MTTDSHQFGLRVHTLEELLEMEGNADSHLSSPSMPTNTNASPSSSTYSAPATPSPPATTRHDIDTPKAIATDDGTGHEPMPLGARQPVKLIGRQHRRPDSALNNQCDSQSTRLCLSVCLCVLVKKATSHRDIEPPPPPPPRALSFSISLSLSLHSIPFYADGHTSMMS